MALFLFSVDDFLFLIREDEEIEWLEAWVMPEIWTSVPVLLLIKSEQWSPSEGLRLFYNTRRIRLIENLHLIKVSI